MALHPAPFDLPVERRIITYDAQGAQIIVSVRRRPDARVSTINGYGILPGRLFYTLDNGMIVETMDELIFTSDQTDEVLRKIPLVDKIPAVPSKLVTEEGHQQAAGGTAVDHPLRGMQEGLPGVPPVE
jgi:hypothetical protein